MIERLKSFMSVERPALDFERRLADSTLRNSFDHSFFNFNDKLRYWTTVYRYLLFMDYEKDIQFMIGIGQKKISNYQVNNVPIEFASNSSSYKVALTYWHHHEELFHRTTNDLLKTHDDGFVSDTLSFKRDDSGYVLKLDEAETNINLTEKFDEDFLIFGNLIQPFHRHNAYFKYQGKIKGEDSKGIAFIQKVAINMPFIPWRWGRTFFENGAQLDFYEPRVVVPVFKSLNFKIDDKVYLFNKKGTISLENKGRSPKWKLSGETENGEEIEAKIETTGHACQIFETQRSRFLYNEYPSKMTYLKITKGGETLHSLHDLGRSATNCEDAYYSTLIGRK